MAEATNLKYEDLLNQARTDLKVLLSALNEAQWQTTVISEGQGWTVADIVAHLLENERGMSIQVHKIRQGRETVPEGFDLTQWNAGLRDRNDPAAPSELLADLDQVRTKTLEVLRSIQESEWNLQGRHPSRGMITIEQYYQTIAGHDQHHADDIRKGLGLT